MKFETIPSAAALEPVLLSHQARSPISYTSLKIKTSKCKTDQFYLLEIENNVNVFEFKLFYSSTVLRIFLVHGYGSTRAGTVGTER